MNTPAPKFSVVMATYTGADVIEGCLKSLINQQKTGQEYEMIVIIDGPGSKLRAIVDKAAKDFQEKGIDFSVTQLKRNKGRFEARVYGARKAKYKHLLFMDDRVTLPPRFFKDVSSLGERAVMPDVEESEAKNLVSFTLRQIRAKVYGAKWGQEFTPFYINADNFDASPKGTAALWIEKDIFIRACEKIEKDITGSSSTVSDDTRVLKELIDNGVPIYKTSKLRVTYVPRLSAWQEIKHIFHRGPKFVDYYLRPGRRYFLPLILFYILVITLVFLLVISPLLILTLLAVSFLMALYITDTSRNIWRLWLGCWLIGLSFGLGLIRGLIRI